ncbi:MAG: endonuclease/exonuclease/phosphatase family protein [Nocardioidaceae bacterium]|nr:MAG: endonuclease/exonuclease/phosphatase family protein [Nocardioidaceae bacterium]
MTLQAVPDVLRVATYNLYLGADLSLLFGATATELPEVVTELQRQLDATDFTSRARAIAAALVRSDADIVGLQEVIRWTRDSELLVDYQDELISALDELGASYQVAVESLNITGGGAGMTIAGSNIILVRAGLPVGDVDSGQFDDALVAPTPMGQVRITRSWATADVGDLTFACVHTEAYDQTVRDAQRDQIVKLLAERTGPVVLAGDFNALPDEVGVPAPYLDAWVEAGGEAEAGFTNGQGADLSHADNRLSQRIDYLWVRAASVEACEVIGDQQSDRTPSGLWPSDHAGVVAAVRLRSASRP